MALFFIYCTSTIIQQKNISEENLNMGGEEGEEEEEEEELRLI